MANLCPACGAPCSPGEKFCQNCGARLPESAPAAPVNEAPAAPVNEAPAAPVNEAPAAPVPPAAPVSEAPAVPVNEAPAAPVNEAPAAPVYEAPAAPVPPAAPVYPSAANYQPAPNYQPTPNYQPAPNYQPPQGAPAYAPNGMPNYAPQRNPAPAYPGAPAPAAAPKKKKTGLIIGLCAGIAVLLAAAVLLYFFVFTPNSLSLSEDSLHIKANTSTQLTAEINPGSAFLSKDITWTSSDESVAVVAEDGTVTARKPGTCDITAATANGKSATCAVTVEVDPAALYLSESEVNLEVGESVTLTTEVLPAEATNYTIKWTSDDPFIATVSDGKITAVSEGSCVITATISDSVSASCSVTVGVAPTAIYLSETFVDLQVGDTLELVPEVLPDNASNYTITWTSDDPSVATVSDGRITAVAEGSCTITAAISDDIYTTCWVDVSAATALSDYDKYVVGEWKLVYYYDFDTSTDVPVENLGLSGKIVFKDDHTARVTMNGESADYTWYFDYVDDHGDYCFWLDNNEESLPFDYIVDNGEIWLYLDETTLTYQK